VAEEGSFRIPAATFSPTSIVYLFEIRIEEAMSASSAMQCSRALS